MAYVNGNYSVPASSFNPAVTNTAISSTDWTALLADLSTALSTCLLKDGTQVVTANIPMAGFKLTGLGAAAAAGDAVRYEQALLAGTGAGTIASSGLINSQTSAVGIGNGADLTDDTLFTYNLPLNSLSANGKTVHVHAWGVMGAGTNNKTLKPWFAGVDLIPANLAANGFNGLSWTMDWTITRVDATHVSVSVLAQVHQVAPYIKSFSNQAVADLTANASIIKVTGASPTSGVAGDVVAYGMTVTFKN